MESAPCRAGLNDIHKPSATMSTANCLLGVMCKMLSKCCISSAGNLMTEGHFQWKKQVQSCPHAMSLMSVGEISKQQSLPYHLLSSEHKWPGLQSTALARMQGLRHMSYSSLMPTTRRGCKPTTASAAP